MVHGKLFFNKPLDNFKEAQELPLNILNTIKLTPVETIGEVLKYALVVNN